MCWKEERLCVCLCAGREGGCICAYLGGAGVCVVLNVVAVNVPEDRVTGECLLWETGECFC